MVDKNPLDCNQKYHPRGKLKQKREENNINQAIFNVKIEGPGHTQKAVSPSEMYIEVLEPECCYSFVSAA